MERHPNWPLLLLYRVGLRKEGFSWGGTKIKIWKGIWMGDCDHSWYHPKMSETIKFCVEREG